MIQNVGKGASDWRGTPFYVVGTRTADSLRPQPGPGCERLYPYEANILGAEESGNAEKLAQFIIRDVQARRERDRSRTPLPLLYLTGDKTLGTIKKKLDDTGEIITDLVQVYETRARADLGVEIAKTVGSIGECRTPVMIRLCVIDARLSTQHLTGAS